MTRTLLIIAAVGAFLSVISGSGCGGGGVGDPCIPEQEYDICFGGFDEMEVNVESKSFQCQTRLCLVNHFQGRVSCPYGQTAGNNTNRITFSANQPGCDNTSLACCGQTGGPPIAPYYPGTGTSTCSVPGGSSLLGDGGSLVTQYQVQVPVKPQVTPRPTSKAVYCSCRCADVNGQTTNGVFCACPDGYTCTQLVTSIGGANQGLTGGYCIKTGTEFQPADLAAQPLCAPPPPGGTSSAECPLPE